MDSFSGTVRGSVCPDIGAIHILHGGRVRSVSMTMKSMRTTTPVSIQRPVRNVDIQKPGEVIKMVTTMSDNWYVECKTKATARRLCPWCKGFVKAEGGYFCFDTVEEAETWEKKLRD